MVMYYHNILKHYHLRSSPSKIQMFFYTFIAKFNIRKDYLLVQNACEPVLFLDCEPSLGFEV